MKAFAIAVIAILGALSAQAETITARSPCLPANLPPNEDADTDATPDLDRPRPLNVDIYEEIELRGSIYGEIAVGNVTVNRRDGRARPLRDDRAQAAQVNACP